jgi:hypothetical protein
MPSQTIIWTTLPHKIEPFGTGSRLFFSVFVSPRLMLASNEGSSVPLKSFPDWIQVQGAAEMVISCWPQTIKALFPANGKALKVEFDPGFSLSQAQRISPDPEESLWKALFSKDTAVKSYAFADHSTRKIWHYPFNSLTSILKDWYLKTALTSPDELIKAPTLKNAANPIIQEKWGKTIGQFTQDLQLAVESKNNALLRESLEQQWLKTTNLTKTLANPAEITLKFKLPNISFKLIQSQTLALGNVLQSPPLTKPGLVFFGIDRFLNRSVTKINPVALDVAQYREFHKMISMLGDFPWLLRRLGLVLDFTADSPLAPAQLKSAGKLRVSFSSTPPLKQPAEHLSPWTQFTLDGSRGLFQAASSSTWIKEGMLNLSGTNDKLADSNPDYDFVQIDTDAAAMKALSLAGEMIRKTKENIASEDEEIGLPELQSSGIGLVRTGRGERLAERFARNKSLLDANKKLLMKDAVLGLEDVLRGYRVDVRVGDNPKWFSLCDRRGNYRATQTNESRDFTDEGFVKSTSATTDRTSDNTNAPLYVHDSLFRWDGWSLCVPRPGAAAVPKVTGNLQQEETLTPEEIKQRQDKTKMVLPLEVTFQPTANGLPPLRFGQTYRMRVRAVDLAGNSRGTAYTSQDKIEKTLEKIDKSFESDAMIYRRFEPVSPPALLPCDAYSEGESLERMVVRSNYNQSSEAYRNKLGLLNRKKPYTDKTYNARHVIPPKTSQLMAETHGAFDGLLKAGKYEEAYNQAILEKKTFFDLPAALLAKTPASNDEIKPPVPLPKEKKELAQGEYLVYPDNNKIEVPYLPDVLARGVVFRGLPGTNGAFIVPYTGVWPTLQALLLRIEESTSPNQPPKLELATATSTPVLKIFLRKAQTVDVRYSSLFSADDLKAMGLWSWIEQQGQVPDGIKKAAETGGCWLLSPYRKLTLVHAVQQPLTIARFANAFLVSRPSGSTYAELVADVLCNLESTGKIDVLAKWEEIVEDPTSEKGYKLVPTKAQAGAPDINFRLVEEPGVPPQQIPWTKYRHEYGDTKHRKVQYYLNATTKFREYFPLEIIKDANDPLSKNISRNPDYEGEAKEHYLTQIVPSSARPATPKVLYVIPTFKWKSSRALSTDPTTVQSRKGGLRIYLERPWFSSGEGERLAVILWGGNSPIPDATQPYVTQIGKDPIWKARQPKAFLSPNDFKDEGQQEPVKRTGLTLSEVAGSFSIAAYNVGWDKQRRLWYCDIEIDVGQSYFPFVRLALARYQPNSIAGAELSRVVMTDFAQLAPERTVTISKSATAAEFQVTLAGVIPSATFPSTKKTYRYKIPPMSDSVPPTTKISLATFPVNEPFKEVSQRRLNEIEVAVEARPRNSKTEFDWAPVSSNNSEGITIQRPPFLLPETLWSGKVTLSSPNPSKMYRLTIKEYEPYLEDGRVTDLKMGIDPPETNNAGTRVGYRLVYADTYDLSS